MRFRSALVNSLHTNNPEVYLDRVLNDRQYQRFEEYILYIEDEVGIFNIYEQIRFILTELLPRTIDAVMRV